MHKLLRINRRPKRSQFLVIGAILMVFWLAYKNLIGSNSTTPQNSMATKQKSQGNKDDFRFLEQISKVLNESGMCDPSHSIIVGGLNQGQSSELLLGNCANIRLHGFEISPTELAAARKNLAKYPNVVYNRKGMGDVNDVVHFTDMGEVGGLYGTGDPNNAKTVEVVPLAEYVAKWSENVTYLLIDVEGYEPIVIAGMGLQHERNRRRFPMFQYELGGTWAEHDFRHPKGCMNQYEVALFLMNRGYELFMIGGSKLFRIASPEFFLVGDQNEGRGLFVQGNALAMHPDFTPGRIVEWMRSITSKEDA